MVLLINMADEEQHYFKRGAEVVISLHSQEGRLRACAEATALSRAEATRGGGLEDLIKSFERS